MSQSPPLPPMPLKSIAEKIKNNNKKVSTIYAYNGTGKTRLSLEIHGLLQNNANSEDKVSRKLIYFNAYTEDLFYWGTGENYDSGILNIWPNSFTEMISNVLSSAGGDGLIVDAFQKYTSSNITPIFRYKDTSNNRNLYAIEFSVNTSAASLSSSGVSSRNIKVSKGEESCFIWSMFFTFIKEVLLLQAENPEDAKKSIVDLFKSVLNREPTAAEIAAATKALNADENNPKNYQTQTPILNKAGQITGYKSTGGTNIDQFLTDYVNKTFASEASAVKTSAPEVTALAKDKATYDKLIEAAKGDLEKINAAKQNTTYGRTLAEYTAEINDQIRSAGATNDPGKAADIAKYIVDRGLNINSEAAKSYIDAQLSFGKNKVTTGDKTTEMYTGKAGSNVDALNKVALANGLTLDKVFDAATLNDVISAVNAGEDIGTYTKIIRDAAKVAWNVPDNVAKLMDQGVSLDAIYQPFKNTYADTLELNPNDVKLSDLAKYGIIGQQSAGSQAPQNLYDFQKALRKDDRWQYTQQAHNEVGNAVQKVLQDFGFMG